MHSTLRSLDARPGLFSRFGGPAIGAIAGIVTMVLLAGAEGIAPGLLFGGLLGLLFQSMAQNWVPFDFKKIRTYKAPEPEWKQPGYTFNNTIPAETGEEISDSILAKICAAILVVAFFGLMILVILASGAPMAVS